MKKIIILGIFIVLSCENYKGNNKELENKLNSEFIKELNLNCIIPSNIKDNRYVLNEKNFQFIDSLALLEIEFIKTNILSDSTIAGYSELIDKIDKKNISFKNIKVIRETELFNCLRILSTNYILFKKTPMLIISNEKEKNDLERIISIYDMIVEDGGINNEILEYYLNNIDLNNRTYRLMFCYLVYEELRNNSSI